MSMVASDPEIAAVISARGIEEVLHFTTNLGLLGILATRAVKSRSLLATEEYLESIFKPNAAYRSDPRWAGHVSLSLSRINTEFFAASGRWHSAEDLWWCVVVLNPTVLTHEDVIFVTTNNIYPAARRAPGAAGLQALFSPEVPARYGATQSRTSSTHASWTTCVQAEALYPNEISTRFLSRIIVATDLHAAVADAQLAAVDHEDVEIVVDEAIFTRGYPAL